jgi:hypothetical protein
MFIVHWSVNSWTETLLFTESVEKKQNVEYSVHALTNRLTKSHSTGFELQCIHKTLHI